MFLFLSFLSFIGRAFLDANRAKNIKNKPRINEDPRDAQMKLLQEEINRLKQELLNGGQPARGNQLASRNGAVSVVGLLSARRVCSSMSNASHG